MEGACRAIHSEDMNFENKTKSQTMKPFPTPLNAVKSRFRSSGLPHVQNSAVHIFRGSKPSVFSATLAFSLYPSAFQTLAPVAYPCRLPLSGPVATCRGTGNPCHIINRKS
jgi:hypothetical protein